MTEKNSVLPIWSIIKEIFDGTNSVLNISYIFGQNIDSQNCSICYHIDDGVCYILYKNSEILQRNWWTCVSR